MTLDAGTRLGRYEIRSKIGEGGMGEVYLARDEKISRDVAIKVLPAAFSADAERLRRFEQEAQAAGALNHPNILVVYDVGTTTVENGDAPYVVSELLEGETLRERMAGTALPQRKAIDYALQIAHGLAAAHDKGILHRDLKPENLFLTKDGRVKILDFGLAKLTRVDDSQSQTEVPTRRVDTDPGVVMGTVGYMSPEQLRGKQADHRSDIFAFGAILYEMLSGRRAFRGESTADTMSAILREDPPDLSETNKNIAPALERVVNHCLEKNPEERFHSSRDLAFAIEALSGSARVSGSTTTVLSALPASKRKRRELLAWTVAAVLLITTVALAFLYFWRPPADERPVRFVVAMPEQVSEITYPTISPDGRNLAFVGAVEGRRFLYMRPVDSLVAQPLVGTDEASTPFWSPDSRHLGFFSGGKLKRVDAKGGPVQTLCDALNTFGGTWNRDGVILIGLDTKGINRVSAAGGAVTSVLTLDESRKELALAWPSFLPDGKHFVYQSWNGSSADSAIYAASIDGGERKLLLKANSSALFAPPGYLLFSRDDTLMAQPFDAVKLQPGAEAFPVAEQVVFNAANSYSSASVSTNGVLVFLSGSVVNRQLSWFDRAGKQLETLGSPGEYNDVVLSRDGKKLALQRMDGSNSDVWLMDIARGVPSRFTFEPGTEDCPIWSPDGASIVFSWGENSPFNLYRKVSTGVGGHEKVFESEHGKEASDWSADGRFIIFTTYDPKTNGDLWLLPLFGDGKPYPLLATPFDETSAYFSPDGRWFAYTSNETGRTEVYVQSFPQSGGKWLVSSGGGAQPHWRNDGRELFYIAPDRTLMAVTVNVGSTFETSTPSPLFATQVSAYNAPNRYAVAPDGQRFLINCPAGEASKTPVTVVLSWAAGLNK